MKKKLKKKALGPDYPFTDEGELEHLMQCLDHSVSRETFSLFKDPDKDLLITWPQPESDRLHAYYESDSYISHTDSDSGIMNKAYQFVKRYALRNKLNLINAHSENSPGKLLDFGCGTGDFLKTCKAAGWEVVGVEPNAKARSLASEKLGESDHLFESMDELILHETGRFDVITMWHVLEHIPDLSKQLENLKDLLKPEGILCVAVPNHRSYDARHYGAFWAAYDVPRHLWHFSRNSMHDLFQVYGMKVEKELPMLFDSFYVSLLSEKIKRGRPAPFSALYRGLLSNIRASGDGEYSSVIYLIKKAI